MLGARILGIGMFGNRIAKPNSASPGVTRRAVLIDDAGDLPGAGALSDDLEGDVVTGKPSLTESIFARSVIGHKA